MPRKVLVADDSVTIQKVVGITFASEDIELSFVDNGEEAIELARQIRPDLIIADVLMPRKSGYDVCEAVKSDPELGHIPVLLLTGTFEPFDVDRSRRVGADGTITKPFESQTLIRQVNDLLARSSSRRDASQRAAAAPVPEVTIASPARAPRAPEEPLSSDFSGGQDETAAAFEELSRDLGMSVPTAQQAPPAAARSEEAIREERTSADLDLDLMPADEPFARTPAEQAQAPSQVPAPPEFGDDFSFDESERFTRAASQEDTRRSEAPQGSPVSVHDDVFEFVDEEGEVLELGEPVTTSRFERSESRETGEMTSLMEDEIHLPAETVGAREASRPSPAGEIDAGARLPEQNAPEGEVWDLSDFEAVEEPLEDLPAEQAAEADAESFWDDAAAEAIDLVESASVDLVDETLLTHDEAETSGSNVAFGELPVERPVDPEAAYTPSLPSEPADESLHASLNALPDLDLETGDAEPLSLEDLPEIEFQAAASAGPAEGATGAGSGETRVASQPDPGIPGIPREAADELVRRAVKDAVEKVTWEAFSDLSETVVKAVKEKVEQIAWEVIPQMAEAMIKEEIRRLQAADEQM